MAGKFSIYKYVKLAGKGWRYARAAYHPNGKIKPDAVLVKGANGKNVEEKHPEGSYFLNFNNTWIPVRISLPKIGIAPFPQPGPHTAPFVLTPESTPTNAIAENRNQVLHVGSNVLMVAAKPSPRLNDPGDGLRGNGRRALTYADLRALYPGVDGRPPEREIELHLTGNMERYVWGFDGYRYSEAEPVHLKLGERVRIVLINDTMMEHPIHLHGLWGELENGQGEFLPFKHTIVVKPAERVSYLVSADTPGRWAYHCHPLYHMKSGMFRTVIVS